MTSPPTAGTGEVAFVEVVVLAIVVTSNLLLRGIPFPAERTYGIEACTRDIYKRPM